MTDQLTSIIGGLVRHGLGIAAGGFVANGTITGSQVEIIGGAITSVIVVIWSVLQKKRAAKA